MKLSKYNFFYEYKKDPNKYVATIALAIHLHF